MKRISIFGIGRVGLPLALVFADKGCKVIGMDIDKEKLEIIKQGKMPFLERGAEELLKKHINNNFLITSSVEESVKNSEYIILTLGTPVDEHMNPIFSQIEGAINEILPHLKQGQTIILRSTVSPETTEYLKGYIEKKTEFHIGKNLYLAFCPERIAEGYSIEEIPEIPQLIGALDNESIRKAEELFKIITEKTIKSDARSVEIAKLYCNMYRYIDFAIANEFMMIAQSFDRDIYEIVNLVNKDYKRSGLKQPGLAGGPCLYKDGFFLINKTPYNELISTAWKINETVPAYLIDRISKKRNIKNAKVVILGLAFKKNIDDPRNSLSYKAKKIFKNEGAEVYTHDPYIEPEDLDKKLKDADIVMLTTNHDYYKRELDLDKIKALAKEDCIICDIWNIFGEGILFRIKKIKEVL
ncbi:MAG: nucleotide sugar dehydrogenase [Nanoarchaeota archaeon]|nr:nucleotide sugar dehydrogenase [Nanoarchaeota archaeon]